MNIKQLNEELEMILKENQDDIIKTQPFTISIHGYIDVLHSEHRDKNVKGKYYAFAKILNSSETYFVSDDYDTQEEAMQDVKEQLTYYCNNTKGIKGFTI